MPAQDPQNLRDLGKRLDDAQARQTVRPSRPPPSHLGIAFRLVTELVAALLIGGALGWGVDWLFGRFGIHTKPVFLIVLFMLGAAAGFRGIIRTANEINAANAGNMPANPVKMDDEE
ncbi:MAG TPA: AtpZ/AtpI family protein [Rhizomicrobium sp.]|nr:AtpZ/AtpI family protein [Rhizomicrobium sp.]